MTAKLPRRRRQIYAQTTPWHTTVARALPQLERYDANCLVA